MGLQDRDYYQKHIAKLQAQANRKPAPHIYRITDQLASKAPPELAPIVWRVLAWCVIFGALFAFFHVLGPNRNQAGAGVGTPESTLKAAEPAASEPRGKPARPPLVI